MTAPLLLAKPFESGKLEGRAFLSVIPYKPSLKFVSKAQSQATIVFCQLIVRLNPFRMMR
jgi:hypothetical protein